MTIGSPPPEAVNYGKGYSGAAVVVTGGAGFIGSNLVRRLVSARAVVTVIDSFAEGSGANPENLAGVERDIKLVRADLRDVASHGDLFRDCRCVFHLAAQTGHVASMDDPVADLSANALGTAALLQVVRRTCPEARLIFTSTRQVYGVPEYQPVDEQHRLLPPDVNAVGKLCAEQLISVFGRAYGLSHMVLRLTNTYGPRMRIRDARQMFLGIWIRNLLDGRPIAVFGDGKQRRDFLFVDDAIDAMLVAGRGTGGDGIYNLGTGDIWSVVDLARLLCEMGSSGSRVEIIPFPAERKAIDVGDFVTDGSAFSAVTGWVPATDMSRGLAITLNYYRHRFASYVG